VYTDHDRLLGRLMARIFRRRQNSPPSAIAPVPPVPMYDQDGLRSVHNHDFLKDDAFIRAYARGVGAAGDDYQWHWRVHTGLWAAATAAKLAGDFVECGVNRGFMSSAVMAFLDWNVQGRMFYLLDTFSGLDSRYISDDERRGGILERNRLDIARGFYSFDIEAVRRNFAEWKNVQIIVGAVPDTLSAIRADKIAYLHLDMNCAPPEIAAADALWDRIVPGGLVLMDDYGYIGFHPQKQAWDDFARRRQVAILSLPTGQGLILKPPVLVP